MAGLRSRWNSLRPLGLLDLCERPCCLSPASPAEEQLPLRHRDVLTTVAGQEEFDRLRPLSYTDVSVILICFAVDYPVSLDNVLDKVRLAVDVTLDRFRRLAVNLPAPMHRYTGTWLTRGSRCCSQWWPEVEHFCAGVPVVLVGTKTDLRTDRHTLDMLKAQGLRPVTAQQGQVIADKIGARCVELAWSRPRSACRGQTPPSGR